MITTDEIFAVMLEASQKTTTLKCNIDENGITEGPVYALAILAEAVSNYVNERTE